MTGTRWTAADVPDQHGRTAVITGANSGLGFETARVLAGRGATVVLACRNLERAAEAEARIRAGVRGAKVAVQELDLASLASVHRAADELRASHPRLDLLINNAGGLRLRHTVTEDGFELTLATNHLGPFALTGLLLDRLLATPGSRIVTVSSIGHRHGRINFADLHGRRRYLAPAAYFQAKLANLMFTYDLQRRLGTTGADTIALAAHPGNASTEFGRDLPAPARLLMSQRLSPLNSWQVQPPEMGALGTLRAATDPKAEGGAYYGPPGLTQFTGHPERVESTARSHDTEVQRRLWEESERLTGVVYPG